MDIRPRMRKSIPELEMELAERFPRFRCRLCARCCRGKIIALYESDRGRLEGLGECYEPTSKEERALTGAPYKMKTYGGRCVFLKGGRCLHYGRRPDTCRRHPFLVTRDNILVASTCPGVDWSGEEEGEAYRKLSEGIAENVERYLARRKAV